MVDPDKEGGSAEPHQNSAEQPHGGYYKSLHQAGTLIWYLLRWPRRWWRGGDHNRRTANATVLLTLGTLVLAAVNLGMLLEMRRGGDQQHMDTIAVLRKTDATIAALNEQAVVMRGQLDEMRATRRPWLTMDARVTENLYYNVNGVNIGLTFTLRNTGLTPATRAWIHPNIFVTEPGDITAAVQKECANAPGIIGVDIFPNGQWEQPIGIILSKEAVDEWWHRFPTLRPAIFPVVVACIVYLSPSDTLVHHTPFVYILRASRSLGPNRAVGPIWVDDDTIPASNLGLVTSIIGSWRAD